MWSALVKIGAALAIALQRFAAWLEAKQLLDAGRAAQRADDLEAGNAKVTAARDAADAARRAGVQPSDPNNRD